MRYRHRQTSIWALLMFVPTAAVIAGFSLASASDPAAMALSLAFLLALGAAITANFSTLTVTVTDGQRGGLLKALATTRAQ
jgi:hypothetical protein